MALSVASGCASAQSYPTKPIRIIVGFAPGGGTDFIARTTAPRLSEALGQPVVVENRTGASGVLAAELGLKAPPDGHTLTLVASNFASYPSLYKLAFDAVKDVQALIQLTQGPFLVAVHPSLPVKTTSDLIALAKKHPGELNFASTGAGALSHLGVEHFSIMANVKMTHIPYKGTGPALIDTIAGNSTVIFGSILPTLPHVRSGRLRGLAVTTLQRVAAEPTIPTVAESGLPGYEVNNWNGIIVPRATPRPVVERLNGEFNRILRVKEVADRLQGDGSAPAGGTPEDFSARIAKEMALWSKVIATAKVKVD
ncbi:MAG: tripartite tricarboxylate transporter substrate binding protein [Burkholderiales bacterium]|nr:tripartite tricarboxylate transporter substrate binding protein [Burkholderiales bacterium]